MGIDLEHPSGEYHKDDSRHHVVADVVDGVDKVNCRNEPTNCLEVLGNDKENAGPEINAELSVCRNKGRIEQGINLNSSKISEPHDGMEFDSKEDAFSYYKEYAKSVGFSAIIKASRRSRISGKFIDAKFACTRYGNKREPSAAETLDSLSYTDNMPTLPSTPVKRKRGRVNLSWAKTDCKACMHVKRRQDGRWVICSFIKDHNHEILPDQAYYSRGHGNLDLVISNADALKSIRARTKKMYLTMSKKSGGYKKVDNKKGSTGNQFCNGQHLALDEGDVRAMLDQFMCMQDENPNFFYAIDLNEEKQLRNLFWVDAKSRLDYRHFGDVILLDTTHIKNEYKLPFVPFIGVNHHFQFLLLGCAIVSDESKSTYMWLMQVWLRAMGGQGPKVILTDQEKALKEAVAEVLPGSRHCFCLWHILNSIYVMTTGYAQFMRTRKTTLKEFLEQYKVTLRGKCEEEAKADFETFHKQPALKSPSPFGKQMVSLYTHAIFKKFQSEVLGVVACHPKLESEDGPTKMFRVQDFEDNQNFIVSWNEMTSDTFCSCRLFEFNGFLCRHVMIVLQISGVHNIPSQYILNRWTKDAKNRHMEREVLEMADSRSKRYNNLCQRALELGDEGSLSQESYIVAVNALEEALRKCESMNNSVQSVMEPSLPILSSQDVNTTGDTIEKNSNMKKRQVHSEPEINAIAIDSSWQQMANSNTRAAGFDCSYESQQSIQEMDQLNSRAQNLDGYFATQQIVSGMGQLNSIATNHNDYYSDHHSIQGLGQLNSIAPIHDAHYMTPQRVHGMVCDTAILAELHFRQETIPSCFDAQDSLPNVDQSPGGPTQLLGIDSKQLNSRHLSR
ncbi:protein FAR-RED IMPAIRED RESPONSE 1-like isoform X1 [Senna tora]|uniref:Protein FAR1-RELATED SEQUENCE n=1 Tax=Senna tora TaxID=362788 RepID=A0A834WIV2_9FABA|nr:protein FAR-RED IMPAIRED RESPONSE 1-like isoform X1 [Senna tora]